MRRLLICLCSLWNEANVRAPVVRMKGNSSIISGVEPGPYGGSL